LSSTNHNFRNRAVNMTSFGHSCRDFWTGLDQGAFRKEISSYDEAQLTNLHAKMKRKMVSANVSGTCSICAAVFTGGFSLIFTAVSARRMKVNNRRRKIVRERLEEKGWDGYGLRAKDWGVAIGASAIGMGVAGGLDVALSHVAADVAPTLAAGSPSDVIATALENPDLFVQGVDYGAFAQVSDVTTMLSVGAAHHATHHATQSAAGHLAGNMPIHDPAGAKAAGMGAHVGHMAAQKAEVSAVKAGVKKGVVVGMGTGVDVPMGRGDALRRELAAKDARQAELRQESRGKQARISRLENEARQRRGQQGNVVQPISEKKGGAIVQVADVAEPVSLDGRPRSRWKRFFCFGR
jgi:hypothetical protein